MSREGVRGLEKTRQNMVSWLQTGRQADEAETVSIVSPLGQIRTTYIQNEEVTRCSSQHRDFKKQYSNLYLYGLLGDKNMTEKVSRYLLLLHSWAIFVYAHSARFFQSHSRNSVVTSTFPRASVEPLLNRRLLR
jgi:hypothetical protein